MTGIMFKAGKDYEFYIRYPAMYFLGSFIYAGTIVSMNYIGFFKGFDALTVIRTTYPIYVIIFVIVSMFVFAWEVKCDMIKFEQELDEKYCH